MKRRTTTTAFSMATERNMTLVVFKRGPKYTLFKGIYEGGRVRGNVVTLLATNYLKEIFDFLDNVKPKRSLTKKTTPHNYAT